MNKDKNNIASILFVMGIIVMVLAFGIGIVVGSMANMFAAFPWWLSGFITGMFLIGFAEVIELLHQINNKLGGRGISGKVGTARRLGAGTGGGGTEQMFRLLVIKYREYAFQGGLAIGSGQISVFEQNANHLVPLKKNVIDILKEDIEGGEYNQANNGITIWFRDGEQGKDSLEITTVSEKQTEDILRLVNEWAAQNRREE